MHILQINTEKGWRGGERQTLLMMQGLRDAGIEVTLLCLKHQPLGEKARAAGFRVIGIGNQCEAFVYCLMHSRKYSVLHAQSSRAFGFAALAKIGGGSPLVYTRRVDFVPRGILTKWKYRQATALVAISGAIRDILRSADMGEATVISSIVPSHTPNETVYHRFKQEQNLAHHQVVGVVAALVGHKDPLTMVRAAVFVRRVLPSVVFLHFGEGDLRNVVEAECRNHMLQDTYRLLGYRNDVEDLFPLFDCFAMSSKEEGLGSTVLDAFKNGVPVAATKAGGLIELVEGRGLLSEIDNPQKLAANIITLLKDRVTATALVNTARTYVKSYHDMAILTGKYIELYTRLAGTNGL